MTDIRGNAGNINAKRSFNAKRNINVKKNFNAASSTGTKLTTFIAITAALVLAMALSLKTGTLAASDKMTIKVGSGVSGKVLYVNGSPYSESWYPIQYINNQSCAIMFTGGGVRFLTAGDLQEQGEKRLLKSGVNLKADIFKLDHHGYDLSNKQFLLDAVNPSYAYFTSNKVTPRSFLS